jgi:hypothetical protein
MSGRFVQRGFVRESLSLHNANYGGFAAIYPGTRCQADTPVRVCST